MKKILSLIVFSFTLNLSIAQTCGAGNISLYSQSAVDNFVTIYSGTCDTINGNLYISGSSVVDLSGLSFLTTVTGYLYISFTNITSSTGLENIISIGDEVNISYNNNLTNLNLNNLNSIGTNLYLNQNTSLNNFNAPNLTNVPDNLTIGYSNFTDLSDFSAILSVIDT